MATPRRETGSIGWASLFHHSGRVRASRERSNRIVTQAREQEKRFEAQRSKVEQASTRLEAAAVTIVEQRDRLYEKAIRARRA